LPLHYIYKQTVFEPTYRDLYHFV